MIAVENRKDYEIGRVNVTDRDDQGTKNWEAKYFITNDPDGFFAVSTDPATNQGVLTVVKVQTTTIEVIPVLIRKLIYLDFISQ